MKKVLLFLQLCTIIMSNAASHDESIEVEVKHMKKIALKYPDDETHSVDFLTRVNSIRTIAFRNKHIVAGTAEGTVWFWDLEEKSVKKIKECEYEVKFITFNPDGKRVVIGTDGKTKKFLDRASNIYRYREGDDIYTWDKETGETAMHRSSELDELSSIITMNNEGTQVVRLNVGNVYVRDLFSGKKLCHPIHQISEFNAAFSPDSTLVALSMNNELNLWDLATGKVEKIQTPISGSVITLTFNKTGTHIAAGTRRGEVALWDLENKTSRLLGKHGDDIFSVAFAHASAKLVSGSSDKTIRVWDLKARTSREIGRHSGGSVRAVAFNDDDTHIVSGSEDSTVSLWADA